MKSIIVMTLLTLGVGAAAIGSGGCEVAAHVDRAKITSTSINQEDAGAEAGPLDPEAGTIACSKPEDCPAAGNECQQATCEQGLCGQKVRRDQSCGDNGQCDGQGRCVAKSCANHGKDPGETDIDCGGRLCPPCADYMQCVDGDDCASRICDVLSHTCGG